MRRDVPLSSALLGLGIALLIAPVLLPIQPVLYHDTDPGTMANRTTLEDRGYEIIAYENLSARGQALYVQTLRSDGEYTVPLDEGAPEFAYPTAGELGALDDYRERERRQTIIIERPPEASLPPPGEPVEAAEHRVRDREERRKERNENGATAANRTTAGPTVGELRQQIGRYDQMTTRTDRPPLTALSSLLRLGSVVGGILAIGIGGYVHSKP